MWGAEAGASPGPHGAMGRPHAGCSNDDQHIAARRAVLDSGGHHTAHADFASAERRLRKYYIAKQSGTPAGRMPVGAKSCFDSKV